MPEKKESRLTNGQISHNQVEMCEEKVTAIHTSSYSHLLPNTDTSDKFLRENS